MADIQNGYSLTRKVGTDLFTVQGVDFETFKANLVQAFGPEGAQAILAAYTPLTSPKAVEAVLNDGASKPLHAVAVAPQGDAVTENQKNFIWKVAKERNLEREQVLTIAGNVAGRALDNLNGLTKREASGVIDAIKAQSL